MRRICICRSVCLALEPLEWRGICEEISWAYSHQSAFQFIKNIHVSVMFLPSWKFVLSSRDPKVIHLLVLQHFTRWCLRKPLLPTVATASICFMEFADDSGYLLWKKSLPVLWSLLVLSHC